MFLKCVMVKDELMVVAFPKMQSVSDRNGSAMRGLNNAPRPMKK